MEKIDFVLVGAEGVVESGGIINKVMQYSILKEVTKRTSSDPWSWSMTKTNSLKETKIYASKIYDIPKTW